MALSIRAMLTMSMHRSLLCLSGACVLLTNLACVQIDAGGGTSQNETSSGDGDGDGDPATGDGDGDPSTGDGDPSTGDGDPSTGDGDPSTGDGDPEPETITGLVADTLLTDDGPSQQVNALALNPAGDRVVAALGANRVVVFALADGTATTVHTIGAGDLFEPGAAVWGSEGFVIGTFSYCLVFDDAGALVHELPERCSYLALADAGDTLIRTTTDSVETVGFASGSVIASAPMNSPAGLGFDGTRVHVLGVGDSYAIESRTLPGLDQPQTHALDVRGLFGGPLRGTLAYADAKVWSDFTATPVTLVTTDLEDQKILAISPDARWVASLGFSEGVHVFDAVTGEHLANASLATASATGLVWDADADRLIAGSSAGVQLFTVIKE